MAEKVWLKSYPPHIPATIDDKPYSSIADLFTQAAKKYADRGAFSNLGLTLTYRELDRQSDQFGAFLQGLPGMQKGDRVALMMPNLMQYPVALFGIFKAGMVVVNVNPLYTPRELEHQLKDSGTKAILIVENFASTLQQVIKSTAVQHVITTQIGDMLPIPKRWIVNTVIKKVKKMVPDWRIDGAISFREAMSRGAAGQVKPVNLGLSDIAFLQYTGGTTGVSKGAVLTHHNLVANLTQSGAWISRDFKEGEEIAVSPLPLYHIFSLNSMLSFMKWGALNVLITNPRDLPAFIVELKKFRFSVLTGVNTLFNGLLNTPGFSELDFSTLKVVIGGGAAVQKSVAEQWQKVTGKYLTEAYGLTETSPGATANPLGTPWNGSIGLPFPSTEISIRSDDFVELPLWDGKGEIEKSTGEICIKGPQVMQGYWQRPEDTAKTIRDGWLLTGDVGHMDTKGYVTITDRKKDMILVSGFNVYPNEIEGVVQMHPGVLECASVGVPDEKSGEAVKVVVVKKDPNLTKEDVIEHCRKHLTGYKMPKVVEFRTDLPKTPVGKILRRELRDKQK